jgi:ABC-type spermidine/putrescine transport system permease subunit II
MRQKKALSSNNRTFLAMTIPIVILFFLFNTLPLITGAVYSFTNYRGYGSFDFVGLRNYIDLFSDERVLHSYLFTFKYAIAGTILINVLSLLLAMGLNSRIRCKSLLRGVYFVPNILGGLIVGYIFSFIFTYIIPAVGKAMHIGFLENSILASEKYAWIGVLIVGVWIFLKPGSIVSLIPIVIGVILAVHGVQDVKMALESKNGGYDRWWIMLIIAIISIAFGVLCIVNAFGMVKLAMQFVGAALIYDGISDLWVVTKTVRTVKEMEREAKAVDVDYKEID